MASRIDFLAATWGASDPPTLAARGLRRDRAQVRRPARWPTVLAPQQRLLGQPTGTRLNEASLSRGRKWEAEPAAAR